MKSENEIHFKYSFEIVKDGLVLDAWDEINIVPVEGLNHFLAVVLNQGAQVPAWYVGLYENDYTPVAGDVMASFPGLAGEISTYSGNRPQAIFGTATGGASSNENSRAEFIFSGVKTVRGGFISSSATKGATSGVLLSAVKLATAKTMDADSELRVTVGISFTST